MKKTLDIHHTNHLAELKKSKEDVAKMQKRISVLEEKIATFKNDAMSDEAFNEHMGRVDERIDLLKKVADMKNKYDETSYFVNTSDILFKYYDLVEKGHGNVQTPDHNTQSILRFFTAKPVEPVKPAVVVKPSTRNRGSLLDNYMSVVDTDYINAKVKDIEIPLCPHCNSANIIIMTNDGYTYCNVCHTMENMIIDHDKPSYKDPPKEITYFSYKRINHLNEWLNQIQGKETTEIPEEIYDKILLEIKKQRMTNMADLSYVKIKKILKQLKAHKYYEHIPHIINRLNGLPMPNFTPELEDKLRTMFKHIQSPFLKHSPQSRKNFLSYSFVLHKSLQLLEKDEYLPFFCLLKSRDKLSAQDRIWQKICEEVGWQYIPSL